MKKYLEGIGGVLVACAFVLMAGCSTIGAAPAKSFAESLAYGYGTLASVRTTCAQSVNSGAITLDVGQKCLTDTDAARTALDSASVYRTSGDNSSAIGLLETATTILTQVQAYITVKGK